MTAIDMEQYRAGDPGRNSNDTSRRALTAHAAASMIPFENRKTQRAADIDEQHARRLVVMLGYIGEIARMLEVGDPRYEDALMKLCSASMAWVVANEANRAR